MTQDSPQSRATEIWKRFGGMFGVDAVERKFGKTPPIEWQAMLGRLKDFEIDRGVKRLAYSGKGHVPTLPEFTRMCREIGGEYDEGPKRPALPNPGTWQGDEWDIEANQRLLKFMTTLVSQRSNVFGRVLPPKRVMIGDRFSHLEAQPSDEQRWATEVLLRHKKAWTQDMREYCDEDGVIRLPSSEYRQRTWDGTMAYAMEEIAKGISQ
jgi:hypothetical protein